MKKYKTEFSKEELHAALHSNDAELSETWNQTGAYPLAIAGSISTASLSSHGGQAVEYKALADKARGLCELWSSHVGPIVRNASSPLGEEGISRARQLAVKMAVVCGLEAKVSAYLAGVPLEDIL